MNRSFLLALVAGSCAACGNHAEPGYTLDIGGDDGGSIEFTGGSDAGAAQALDAYVEQGQVAVKLITLSCAGACATVQAVGTGGNPPYAYAWENGSTSAVRQVCPSSDASYSVKVTDTGETGEFSRLPEVAHAAVSADLIACPADAGPMDAGYDPGDAGAPDAGPVCIDPGSTAWSGCITAEVGDEAALTSASAFGQWCSEPTQTQTPYTWSVCLPKSLLPGTSYSITVTYDVTNLNGPIPKSGVLASTGACEGGESLVPLQTWPIVSLGNYSGSFTQTACFTAITRYPQLLYQEVQQALSGYDGTLTTFQICTGCGDQ